MFLATDQWQVLPQPRHAPTALGQPISWRHVMACMWAIVHGEGDDVLAGESGMLTFLTALVVVMFAVLLGLVANVAYTARQKVDVQNSADAIASSASLWEARGMNAITAANHLSGELTALCALQYSFGGPELDDGSGFTTDESSTLYTQLKALKTGADGLAKFKTYQTTYDQIQKTNDQKFKAGATIYDARMTLESLFFYSLLGHDLGGIIYFIPYVGPFIDAAIELICAALDYKILQEWITLNAMESVASSTIQLRKALENQVLPLIQSYATMVTRETPVAMDRTVKDLSQKNNVKGALFPFPTPVTLKLPVEKEHVPTTSGTQPESRSQAGGLTGVVQDIISLVHRATSFRDFLSSIGVSIPGKGSGPLDILSPPADPTPTKGFVGNPSRGKLPKSDWPREEKSQWVRATYPWVNYWRAPIRKVMDVGLTLSLSSAWYLHWSNRYTLGKSHEFRTRGSPLFMYVMQDSEKFGRGKEPWTKAGGSARADQLFCVVGFSHQPAKTIAMPSVFGKPQQNSKGLVAFSQAMVYNANRQAPNANNGELQPDIAWNTLNWKSPLSSGSNAYEYCQGVHDPSGFGMVGSLFSGDSSNAPVVQLNWQTKLTPVTRLFNEPLILGALPAEHRDVLYPLQVLPGKSMFMNH